MSFFSSIHLWYLPQACRSHCSVAYMNYCVLVSNINIRISRLQVHAGVRQYASVPKGLRWSKS